jgi:hypothetical protein
MQIGEQDVLSVRNKFHALRPILVFNKDFAPQQEKSFYH